LLRAKIETGKAAVTLDLFLPGRSLVNHFYLLGQTNPLTRPATQAPVVGIKVKTALNHFAQWNEDGHEAVNERLERR
jgi:hypothetical protein